MSAPATPAAGPDRIVRMGRRRTSSTVMTPPSQRITMSGEVMLAALMADSVMAAVWSIRGMIEALTTAVRVRVLSPYSLEISLVAVDGSPARLPRSVTRPSPEPSSTLNASAATMELAPAEHRRSMAASMASGRSVAADLSMYSFEVFRVFPGASSRTPICVSARALTPSIPDPSVIMPTGETSPSSSALVAWVVPWAMKTTWSALRPALSMSRWRDSMIPAATPSRAVWVVGTLTEPTSSNVVSSIATASVNVPPTSMPMRTFMDASPWWVPRLRGPPRGGRARTRGGAEVVLEVFGGFRGTRSTGPRP